MLWANVKYSRIYQRLNDTTLDEEALLEFGLYISTGQT